MEGKRSNSSRTGWEDVIPLPQEDCEDPAVSIKYSPIYRGLMDLFRAVMKSGELSERALQLTEELLDENPGGYTVWQYRRECLRALGADLEEELDFMDKFADDNPKNYQIWHHRRTIVDMHNSGDRELQFTADVFAVDAKNYHAWAHRQWVLSRFNLWDGEIEYAESLLEKDIRNNSAWNQRWFALHRGAKPSQSQSQPQSQPQLIQEIIERELAFVLSSLDKASKNESAWNYLRGLLRCYGSAYGGLVQRRTVERCLMYDDSGDVANSASATAGKSGNPNALGLLADIRESEGTLEALEHAAKLLSRLQVIDHIRVKYWSRRAQYVREQIASMQAS